MTGANITESRRNTARTSAAILIRQTLSRRATLRTQAGHRIHWQNYGKHRLKQGEFQRLARDANNRSIAAINDILNSRDNIYTSKNISKDGMDFSVQDTRGVVYCIVCKKRGRTGSRTRTECP
jgi:hypothetical protein